MFSLCIPTINRYDNFLSKNLPKYIKNSLIDEIIICDENGNDIDKIKKSNLNLDKVKLFKNDNILGPFLNKIKVCKKAKNEWIALIDSDNFAYDNYFITAKNYIENNNCNNLSILAPSWAQPRFDYRDFENKIINKTNLKTLKHNDLFLCCMNTGNYIINKNLIDIINLDKETDNIKKSPSCDVIFFNTLLFEQTGMDFHIIKDLYYEHIIHDDSIYIKTNQLYKKFNMQIHQRFKNLQK